MSEQECSDGGCRCLQVVPTPLHIAIQRKLDSHRDEIERLRDAVRDAYIEGHEDGGQCWSKNFKPGKGYAENHWHESDAKKAAEATLQKELADCKAENERLREQLASRPELQPGEFGRIAARRYSDAAEREWEKRLAGESAERSE